MSAQKPVSKNVVRILERYQSQKLKNLLTQRSQTYERTMGLWNFVITEGKQDYRGKSKTDIKSEYLDSVVKGKKEAKPDLRLVKLVKQIKSSKLVATAVLTICLILYLIVGALIFAAVEQPSEIKKTAALRKDLHDSAVSETAKMLHIIEQYCSDNTVTLAQCRENLTAGLEAYAHERNEKLSPTNAYPWRFDSAFFYCFSIVTTIGYGNIACDTSLGQVLTMIYAVFGIPLMLICLNFMGKLATVWVQKLRHVCICFMSKNWLGKLLKIDETKSRDRPPKFSVLLLVCISLFLFAGIFLIWEDWDYLTSFYFTFISLTTIGFGDVVPKSPKTAPGGYIFVFIGLGLFSMYLNIAQERLEDQYVGAMLLLEESYAFADTHYQGSPSDATQQDETSLVEPPLSTTPQKQLLDSIRQNSEPQSQI